MLISSMELLPFPGEDMHLKITCHWCQQYREGQSGSQVFTEIY